MTLIQNVVTDQYGRAIAAAQVEIRDVDGALVDLDAGNPLITDSIGAWSCDLDPGTYELVISKGDDFLSRAQVVCGDEDLYVEALVARRIFASGEFSLTYLNDGVGSALVPVPFKLTSGTIS